MLKMTPKDVPFAERIAAVYPRLVTASSQINKASDELAKATIPIEAILKKLNLGVPTWTQISGNEADDGHYWSRDVGYTKVGGDWGLALRTTNGHNSFEDSHREEVWPFNEAPRWLRVEGVGKLPDLLETLVKRADETTKKIQGKAKQASEIAAALAAAAEKQRDLDGSDSEA